MQSQGLTDIGKKRKVNQDYIFESNDPVGVFPNLYILADGMGGSKAGDYASKFLVNSIVSYISKTKSHDAVKVMKSALNLTNSLIFEKSHTKEELNGMGSTFVAAMINDSVMTVVNVGDSRAYLIRDGITQITKDHSYVQEMMDSGKIVKNSKEYISNKHYITRAVGAFEKVDADFFEVEVKEGDYILLCSDGLTNMVSDDEILAVISGNGSLQYKTNLLISYANANGGNDNIAVILVKNEKGGDSNVR